MTGLNDYLGSLKAHFTIAKADPSLKLKVIGTVTKAINDKTFNIGATTTSDATIAYRSSKTAVATVSKAGKVTPKGYGTTAITATVPESAHYFDAKATMKVKVVPKKKKTKVTWMKDSTVTGYELQYAKNSSFKSAKKKYYFRIRSYKIASGTKYYGAYSSVKSVKIK